MGGTGGGRLLPLGDTGAHVQVAIGHGLGIHTPGFAMRGIILFDGGYISSYM